MPRTLNEVIASLPEAERTKVEARARQLIAEEMSLQDLRKAIDKTQIAVAKRLKVGQDAVSKLKTRSDIYISTLRSVLEAMGDELELIARFPDRPPVRLEALGTAAQAASAIAGRRHRLTSYGTTMRRDEVIAKLREHEADLRRLGVERPYLFGSTARGEAREESDVDQFFDYPRGKFGLFELMDVKEQASRILGCKADIMTRDSLHKLLRPRIEASALRVF